MNPVRFATIAILSAMLGSTAGAQTGPEPITVTLTSYRFDPNPLVLQADQPVRLIFENRAGKSHDFVARGFFKSAQLISGQAKDGRVNLKEGQRQVVELVPRRGVYEVHCSKFLHAGFGMKASIIVQ